MSLATSENIYVQDVRKWVDYYSSGIHSPHSKKNSVPDGETSGTPNAGTISEIGPMSVAQVEPKLPLPPVPTAAGSAAFRTVTPSETAVQQATFDAMRTKIDNAAANITHPVNRKKRPTPQGRGRGRGRGKSAAGNSSRSTGKNQLFGTPHDIFRTVNKPKNGGRKGPPTQKKKQKKK